MLCRLAVAAIAVVVSLLWVSPTEAHYDVISPRDHADINNNGNIDVIDMQQTAACTNPCANLALHDHNGDNTINVVDLQMQGSCQSGGEGPVNTTPCGNYSWEDTYFDSRGNHDGCISLEDDGGVGLTNDPGYYDWAFAARPGGAPEGNKLTPWYQITVDHCISGSYDPSPEVPAGPVSITSFRSYAYDTNGNWTSLGSGLELDQWGNRPLGFDNHDCSGEWTGDEITDGIEFTPGTDPVCIAHGWVYPRVTPPSNYVCAAVFLTVDAPAGFITNVGMDDYNTETYIKDIGIGRFRYTGKVGWSSCPASTIRTDPPPF